MFLWRISDYPSLDGGGGLLYSARWHTAGQPVVYLAESAPGAMLEVLVHLELDEEDIPPAYTLLRVEAPDNIVPVPLVDAMDAIYDEPLRSSRALGDEWLRGKTSALAVVPSVIMPHTRNYLLNPLHADAQRILITSATRATYDHRLLRLI